VKGRDETTIDDSTTGGETRSRGDSLVYIRQHVNGPPLDGLF